MTKVTSEQRRKWRVRKVLKKAAEKNERPRLSVHRSGKHIYAQIIDDAKGVTLASASTLDAALRKGLKSTANKEAAAAVGKQVAENAKKAGVEQVQFDRGAFKYHGRIKELADAARAAGLSF
jgi:large subunit ribosomal protein L18